MALRRALLCAALSCAATGQVVELHGSGTTNPSKFFWQAMDLFESRAKMPLYMTYRGIGSGAGQAEFVGKADADAGGALMPYNHFGSGDIPMSAANFAKLPAGSMVHVPFAMGAIAIFHNVPVRDHIGAQMKLTGCVLAKIFSRQITEWDDPAILELNPSLKVPAGTNIKVVHRILGSSSTAGTTQYLEKKCPTDWKLGSGATIPWPADTSGVEGSGSVSGFIAQNAYAIGYVDAGHGHSLGLQEVALMNAAGTTLTSKEADLGAAGAVAISGSASVIPRVPTADWSGVNLYDLPGGTTWPIMVFSYFYVRSDLRSMDVKTAALLRAYIEFSLSAEGQAMLESFDFTRVPEQLRSYNNDTLVGLQWPAAMPSFTFETEVTQVGPGAEDYVLSAKRRSYVEVEQELFNMRLAALEAEAAEHRARPEVVELHGGGTTNPSLFFWEAMALFEARARVPLAMSYRGIGSGAGQFEFVGEKNPAGVFTPYNHFGSGDIPMSAENFAKLRAPMVHVPFAIGAIAIFHNVPAQDHSGGQLKLTGCVLAKIFSRQIKTWDNPEVLALNPSLKVPPGTNIKVVHRILGSSSTAGTTQYLALKCPADWKLGSGSTIAWPADTSGVEGSGSVSGFIAQNAYAIGYVDAGHGHSLGLQEVALTNKAGKTLTSKEASIGAAVAAAVSATPSVIPADPSADWSAVNLYDLAGDATWPITMFSYFYVQKDLTAMSPPTAGLLKAFMEFSLSPEGQARLQKFDFVPVPKAILDYNSLALQGMAWPRDMPTFAFENETVTLQGSGAELHVLSAKRRRYGEYASSTLEKKLSDLQGQVGLLTAQLALAQQPTVAVSGDAEDKVDPTAIAAIVVACVAVLFSSVSVCYTLRATRTVCFSPLQEPRSGGATALGAPQL